MPKVKFTKSGIDALPISSKDIIYWDSAQPGFGIKVTPKGRKVFMVLYRVAGAGSRVRKYTIGPLGQVTLHQARIAAQRVFAARLEGRWLGVTAISPSASRPSERLPSEAPSWSSPGRSVWSEASPAGCSAFLRMPLGVCAHGRVAFSVMYSALQKEPCHD